MDADFGSTDGRARLLTLANEHGLVARVSDYGATLVELHVPDRHGASADVVLGFDSVRGYQSPANQYFGATIGRVANRIAHAAFTLDGTRHQLAANEPPHHLHGGRERSFDKVVWRVTEEAPDLVALAYASPAGEEGYPGRVEATATYRLTGDALVVEYRATTDATTPVNMTNHAYWNLRGAGDGTVLDHEVAILADAYTPTDDALIPTGEVAGVAGTPLDLRAAAPIGARIGDLVDTPALGYDHNYVLRDRPTGVRPVATVREPSSGRVLELLSDQPALQLYSGNRLLEPVEGKNGATYVRHGGLCLEPQGFPDAVHHPQFPSVLLAPADTYGHVAVYRFSTD